MGCAKRRCSECGKPGATFKSRDCADAVGEKEGQGGHRHPEHDGRRSMTHRSVHRAMSIIVVKRGAFTVRCGCGAEEYVGTWHGAPSGWSRRQWPAVMRAAQLLLESVYLSKGGDEA